MENLTLEQVLNAENHEDFVEYFVFPFPLEDTVSSHVGITSGGGGDNNINNGQCKKENLEEILYQLNATAQEIIGEYVWHKESFALRLVEPPVADSHVHSHSSANIKGAKDKKDTKTSDDSEIEDSMANFPSGYFRGITRFGENVEDEWFIVHILKRLTEKFPDLIVRVVDNDGEFLLIEAADHLPNWAESDSLCLQRVYLYRDKIHLIPRAETPAELALTPLPGGTPYIIDAIRAVRSYPEKTIANTGIQKSVVERIGNYPEKMFMNFHHVNVILPPKLAVILKQRPNLLASAVQAFHYRDPVDLKASRLMKNFKPGDCLVKSRVRFTKCLYAMLSKQDFRPDPKTGWGFPRPTSYEFRAHSLGAKLTTGFEILLSRAKSQLNENGLSDSSSGWYRYEESLKNTGYFQDFMEGSKPFQQLAEKAKAFFLANMNGEMHDVEESVIQDIQKLVKSVQIDIDALRKEGSSLPADDSDQWMDINPENLDSLLEAQFKTKNLNSNPNEIPAKLKEFMKQLSDFQGVEVANGSQNGRKENSVDLKSKQKSKSPRADDSDISTDILEPLEFRADDFVTAMDKLLLELGKPDRDWDPSDDSYGSEDEDAELDLNLEEIKKMHDFKKDSKIFELMNQMDAELAATDVGKSFSTTKSAAGTNKSSKAAKATTTAAGPATMAAVEELDEFDDVESFQPVDIDMNALANILESFQSQEGPAGPSANLLRSVGFDLSHMYSKK